MREAWRPRVMCARLDCTALTIAFLVFAGVIGVADTPVGPGTTVLSFMAPRQSGRAVSQILPGLRADRLVVPQLRCA